MSRACGVGVGVGVGVLRVVAFVLEELETCIRVATAGFETASFQVPETRASLIVASESCMKTSSLELKSRWLVEVFGISSSSEIIKEVDLALVDIARDATAVGPSNCHEVGSGCVDCLEDVASRGSCHAIDVVPAGHQRVTTGAAPAGHHRVSIMSLMPWSNLILSDLSLWK